jgi:peptidoglycan/LPS O-acetylase OafA/YrhL
MPPALGYRPALDGLRAVAVVLVLCFHAWQVPGGGFLGVDVFFVLSGFLITGLLLSERRETGRVDLIRFYGRRARRLVPALVVAVAGFLAIRVVAVVLFGDAPGELGRDVAASVAGLLYISNVLIAAAPQWPDGMRHLWSLAAEEQFYLLWPPLLIAGLARFRSLRGAAVAVAAAILAIWAWRLGLTLRGAPQGRLYFAPDTSLDPILLGCLLALLDAAGRLPRRGARAVVPLAAGLAVGMVAVLPNTDPRWIYAWGLAAFGVAVAAVLGSVVAAPRSLLARALAVRPLPQLGRISYGIYLWHPILLFAAHVPKPVSIPAAIAAAAASNRVVEQRFRRPGRATASPARPAPALRALPD